MNQSFVLKDLDINLPGQEVSIKVGELSMNVENANVLEIAQSYGQMMKSFLHLKAELEKDQIFNSDEESPFGEIVLDGEEGHRRAHTFSTGDYIREGYLYAGYIKRIDGDIIEYEVMEIAEKAPILESEIKTQKKAHAEELSFAEPGELKAYYLNNGQFELGDFVLENDTYAGYIIELFPDDSVEYIITEVGSPDNTGLFGTRITAYTETLQKVRPGTLKFLAGKY